MILSDFGSYSDLLTEARWFPDVFDARRGEVRFVATDRAALSRQNFLDWRWKHGRGEERLGNAAALVERLPEEKPAPTIIWHTGFCCSTLLAKALDRADRNLTLCEPQALVHLADAKRQGLTTRDPLSSAPRLLIHLLSRGFTAGERITLKPAPAANTLVREAAQHTSGQMLFLYSDCRSFLVSVWKLGEEGRKYVRGLFLVLLADGHPQSQWPVPKLLALSDLELAGMVWHMQIAEFLRNWPLVERGASLDCDVLLSEPCETLCRVDEFFALNLGREHVEELLVGPRPLFARNAKTGEEKFDARRRQDEHARIARELGPDLDRVVAQSYDVCNTTPRGAPLPQPLISIEKSYCP